MAEQQSAECMICGHIIKRSNSMWFHLKTKHGELGMKKDANYRLTDKQPTNANYHGRSKVASGLPTGPLKVPKVLETGKGELSYVEVPVVLRIPVAFGGITVVEQA